MLRLACRCGLVLRRGLARQAGRKGVRFGAGCRGVGVSVGLGPRWWVVLMWCGRVVGAIVVGGAACWEGMSCGVIWRMMAVVVDVGCGALRCMCVVLRVLSTVVVYVVDSVVVNTVSRL